MNINHKLTPNQFDDLDAALADVMRWKYRLDNNTIKTTADWHMFHSAKRRLAEIQDRIRAVAA